MLSIFSNKNIPAQAIETKSSGTRSLIDYLRSNNEWAHLSAFQSLRYYSSVSTVATGVDMVVDNFRALHPVVLDKVTKQYDTSSDIVKFLSNPSVYQSSSDFFKSLGTYYQVTGTVYLLATGNPTRKPVELSVVSPTHVTVQIDKDGLPSSYTVSSDTEQVVFKRNDTGGKIRYFNGDSRELYCIKDFNYQNAVQGASKLDGVYYELEQMIYTNKHNLSLLKQGGRLSGAIKIPAGMSTDDYNRLKDELASKVQGADNAGAVLALVDGLEWIEMGQSNKDMDFALLKNELKESIYTRLSIPLPLVATSTMTHSNYATAQVALYDNAVIPLMSKLYGEIQTFLGARFNLSEDQLLTVDQSTIPALQERRLNILVKQTGLNVLSVNEIRSSIGYESIGLEGDLIYKPMNMTSVGDDDDTRSNRVEPSARKEFVNLMLEQKGIDGTQLYTLDEVTAFADNEFL